MRNAVAARQGDFETVEVMAPGEGFVRSGIAASSDAARIVIVNQVTVAPPEQGGGIDMEVLRTVWPYVVGGVAAVTALGVYVTSGDRFAVMPILAL